MGLSTTSELVPPFPHLGSKVGAHMHLRFQGRTRQVFMSLDATVGALASAVGCTVGFKTGATYLTDPSRTLASYHVTSGATLEWTGGGLQGGSPLSLCDAAHHCLMGPRLVGGGEPAARLHMVEFRVAELEGLLAASQENLATSQKDLATSQKDLATSRKDLATSQEEVQTLRARIGELEGASTMPTVGHGVRLAELVKSAKDSKDALDASCEMHSARLAELVKEAKAAAKETLDAVNSREQHDKFAETTFTLAYTSLSAFFGGLEARIGVPSPNLRVAMRIEHCTSADSADEYTTGNYFVTTTPEIEWHVAVNPAAGLAQLKRNAYPTEMCDIAEQRKRQPCALSDFLPALAKKNEALRHLGEPQVLEDEVLTGRLCITTRPQTLAAKLLRCSWPLSIL